MKSKIYLKLLFLAVIVLIHLSCGRERPILNSENPFIVWEISEYNSTHSSYYGGLSSATGNCLFCTPIPRIVAPTGMYNIGDTIVLHTPCN
jgi:hypothetical protein